jgi:monovalent cation:H+ antiporter-2, CPA2 family
MQELAISYVAFDLNPVRVAEASRRGLPVFYGDGAQPSVLHAAGEREGERD